MHPGPASHPGDGGTPPGHPGYGRSAPPPPAPPAQPPAGAPVAPPVASALPAGPGASAQPYNGVGAPPAPAYASAARPGLAAPAGPPAPAATHDAGYPAQPRFEQPSFGPGGPGRPGGPDGPGGHGGRGGHGSGRTPSDARPAYSGLRGTAAFICLLLTVLLAIPAVTASWLKEELISDSGFADNAVELIKKPAIRDEIQTRIADEVINRSGIPEDSRAMVISAVGSVMTTDEFARVWKEGAKTAHNVVVNTLLGKDSELTKIDEDSLTIKVQTPLDPLIEELTKAGVRVDRVQLPTEIPVPLADIPDSGPAQDLLKGVDDAGWMLPALAIAFLAAGLAVAVHRLRALALTAMGTLVAGGVLLVATNLARSPVVDEAAKGSDLSSEATGSVYDVFTDTLVTDSWIVIVISIVALAGAAIGGTLLRSRTAARSA